MPALAPDQVNALLVKKLIQDLVIECSSATQAVIKSGSRAGADDGSVIIEAPSDLTLDITTSGKNGLDTGAEASDTWYYLYLIFNPDTEEVAGLISASATAPTLPSGFTKKRLVGAVRNDGSSDFIRFYQLDVNHYYEARQQVSSVASNTLQTISVASYVPSALSKLARLNIATLMDNNSPDGCAVLLRMNGASGNTYYCAAGITTHSTSGPPLGTDILDVPVKSDNFQYQANPQTGTGWVQISVTGFTLSL